MTELFPGKTLSLSYQDEDGDYVLLSSGEEFSEALRVMAAQGDTVLHLRADIAQAPRKQHGNHEGFQERHHGRHHSNHEGQWAQRGEEKKHHQKSECQDEADHKHKWRGARLAELLDGMQNIIQARS